MHQGWGGDEGNTELKAEEAAANDAAAEAIPESSAEGPEPAAEAQPEDRSRKEREPEEDDSTLTFDQYLAQKKEKESSLPKLETTREANEGNNSLWKDAVPLSKNDDEQAYFVGKVRRPIALVIALFSSFFR
jgi:plasminogen activator inhibitor 1 RNA-binding protein